LEQNNASSAHKYFKIAYESSSDGKMKPIFQSYFGFTLAKVEGKEITGQKLMKKALQKDFYTPELFINLAKFYLFTLRDRKRGVRTLHQALKYSPGNRKILELLQTIGTRKNTFFSFLPRKNFLNRWWGLRTNKKNRSGK
jgi:hypothetical protein